MVISKSIFIHLTKILSMLKFIFTMIKNISQQNFLKAIYQLSSDAKSYVSFSALVDLLQISNAAISDMSSKLSEQGLIDYQKYKGIKILPKGKKIALDVIRKHRLWELFLLENLDIKWSEVHSEAELLEHCTSDFLADKIDEKLNYPLIDPHGEPIPDKKGILRAFIKDLPLSKSIVGKKYEITRVNDRDIELIKYLSSINLKLNELIDVVEILDYDYSVTIIHNNKKLMLSSKISQNIFITELKN